VKQVEPEIDQHAGRGAFVDGEVILREMEAARTNHQGRQRRKEGVALAGLRLVGDRSPDGVHQVRLAADEIGPCRRRRILEVRHEDVRAGVQRVDDHLAVDRTGDFDTPVLEIGGDRADGPVAAAYGSGLGEKVGAGAVVEARLRLAAALEQLVDARPETPRELFDECDGSRGQNAVRALDDLCMLKGHRG
jgi:hypothetical protein